MPPRATTPRKRATSRPAAPAESPVDAAKRLLEENRQARVTAFLEELEALAAKYDVTIQASPVELRVVPN